MIIGAHTIVFSRNPGADGAFLRDIFKLTAVDAGGGFMIYGLPPAELAVHGADSNNKHELYVMVDDVNALIAEVRNRGLAATDVSDQGWGLVTTITLPGGGNLSIYQPRHTRPTPMGAKAVAAKRTAPAKKKAKPKAKPKKKTAKKRKR
jgi:hypothetical protein